jgi:EPS-associated MarR family transcriptional regulator
MRLIEQNPKASQRELANQLNISLGGINYCIKTLIERGYVKVSNFNENPHKFSYAYLLTPKGIAAKAALTAQFLTRKLAEYETLKKEIESIQQMSVPKPALPLEQSGQKFKSNEL